MSLNMKDRYKKRIKLETEGAPLKVSTTDTGFVLATGVRPTRGRAGRERRDGAGLKRTPDRAERVVPSGAGDGHRDTGVREAEATVNAAMELLHDATGEADGDRTATDTAR